MEKRRQSTRHHPLELELPYHIVLDILLRLPFKSRVKCKSVCKQWFTLISDTLHLHPMLIAYWPNIHLHMVELRASEFQGLVTGSRPTRITIKFKTDDYLQIVSSSCMGLLLFMELSSGSFTMFAIQFWVSTLSFHELEKTPSFLVLTFFLGSVPRLRNLSCYGSLSSGGIIIIYTWLRYILLVQIHGEALARLQTLFIIRHCMEHF